MKVYVLTDNSSNRLKYICKVIFEVHLGLGHKLIHSVDEFNADNGILIAYGQNPVSLANINIWEHAIISEKGISESYEVKVTTGDLPAFFQIQAANSEGFDFSFDLFSLCFYCLTRYEEYLPFSPDKFGRFQSQSSLAHRASFLHLPLVDLWILELKAKLESTSGRTLPVSTKFVNQPTIDIDLPYAFKGKNLQNYLGFIKDMISLKFDRSKKRVDFLISGNDPFDTYQEISEAIRANNLMPIYFILVRNQKPFDENHLAGKDDFRLLVQKIALSNDLGIHPSYASNSDSTIICQEKALLESMIGLPVKKSRQHFLRLSMPSTYEALLKCGIREDHSMMYADQLGFRASTCIPFPWYNLKNEVTTELTIYPPCIMDVTLKKYMNMTIEEAVNKAAQLKQQVMAVNGHFIWIWHNSSFSSAYGWKDWSVTFQSLCTT